MWKIVWLTLFYNISSGSALFILGFIIIVLSILRSNGFTGFLIGNHKL